MDRARSAALESPACTANGRPSDRRQSVRALLKLFLPALAAFVALAVTLALRAPWPEEYGYAAKLEFFEEHKDEFDVVYFGSSRVFRGIDPRIVDAELAAAGVPARSFNLAVGGMGAFETDYLLQRIAEMKPARLRWIIFEGLAFDPTFIRTENVHAARTVFWHTPAETKYALQATSRLDTSWFDKLSLGVTHVQLLLWKYANYGSGQSFVAAITGESRDPYGRALTPEQLADGRGYQALETMSDKDDALLRANLLANRKAIEEQIAQMTKKRSERPDLSDYDLDALRAQYRAAESMGARLVYLLFAAVEAPPEILALHERGDIPLLFDFYDPERFPKMFDLELYFDAGHLNREGAVEFSKLLGATLAEQMKREGRN